MADNKIHPGVETWRKDLCEYKNAISKESLPHDWEKKLQMHMERLKVLDQKLRARELKVSDLYILGVAKNFYPKIFNSLKKHDESRDVALQCEKEAKEYLPYKGVNNRVISDILQNEYLAYVEANSDLILTDICGMLERASKGNFDSKSAVRVYIELVRNMQTRCMTTDDKELKQLANMIFGASSACNLLYRICLKNEDPYEIIDFNYIPFAKAIASAYPCVPYLNIMYDRLCRLNLMKTLASHNVREDKLTISLLDKLEGGKKIAEEDAYHRSLKYLLSLQDKYVDKDVSGYYSNIIQDIYNLDFVKDKIAKIVPQGNKERYNKRLVFNLIGLLCDHGIFYVKASRIGKDLNNDNKRDFTDYLDGVYKAELSVDDIREVEEIIKHYFPDSISVLNSKGALLTRKKINDNSKKRNLLSQTHKFL